MRRVAIIVPVAPFEPLALIERSIESLSSLDTAGLDVRMLYVIDSRDNGDARPKALGRYPVTVLSRSNTRGRRAGAVNDALEACPDADYIALFDVDSRPERNFLVGCVNALEGNGRGFIASGRRYITNTSRSRVAEIIGAEYTFFAMVYELFERLDGFKQFNGLIGVMPAGFGKLDEHVSCEDFDLTQRMYLRGKIGLLVKDTRVGEQAPLRLRELYDQRVRWLNGAFQGLSEYRSAFHRARIPAGRKLAWFVSGTFPFVAFTAAPLAALFGLTLAIRGRASLFAVPGLVLHVWLITICGARVIAGNVLKKKIDWKDSSRTDD